MTVLINILLTLAVIMYNRLRLDYVYLLTENSLTAQLFLLPSYW